MAKIKINGRRSLETKLWRLHREVSDDAARILCDHPEHAHVADMLQHIAAKLRKASSALELVCK